MRQWTLGSWAYEWNANGSLKSVKKPSGQTISFEYDALGRRTKKFVKDKTIHYIWSGNVLLHEIFDNGKEQKTATYVYEQGNFVPTAKLVDNESFSIVSDYIGRPIQVYDQNGDSVWSCDYDIYGKLINLQGDKSFIPFRQLGQYEDVETGLYYNRFRYYDPNRGLYISQDPIGLAGGLSFYAYVHDVNGWVDIFGLSGIFTPAIFNAPSGNVYTVYQQNIDWNLAVKTSEGIKTNLELAQMGKSPFIVKNGKYSQIQLHHSKQNAKGPLFELSTATHQKYKGFKALHPYLPNKHPINQVDHGEVWKADREAYWKQRAEAEMNDRKVKLNCG